MKKNTHRIHKYAHPHTGRHIPSDRPQCWSRGCILSRWSFSSLLNGGFSWRLTGPQSLQQFFTTLHPQLTTAEVSIRRSPADIRGCHERDSPYSVTDYCNSASVFTLGSSFCQGLFRDFFLWFCFCEFNILGGNWLHKKKRIWIHGGIIVTFEILNKLLETAKTPVRTVQVWLYQKSFISLECLQKSVSFIWGDDGSRY